jgi:hypothetical protein
MKESFLSVKPARMVAISCMLSVTACIASGDDLLLAVIEFDGLPTGIRMLDPVSGEVLGDFVAPDFKNNGMLFPVEAISAGPNRTVLLGQPGGDGAVFQYDETGNFMGVFIGGTADPNPVDNVRSMVVSDDGRFLYTADWDDTNDVHRFDLADGMPDGIGIDALGTLIFGSQDAPGLGQPQAIEMLEGGDLLVGDLVRRRLVRYNALSGDRIGNFSETEFVGSIQDIDQLDDGSVVSSESGSGDRVRLFSSKGGLISEFGFSDPDGVHVLPGGNYLVGSGSSFGQGSGLFCVSPDGTVLAVMDSSRSYGAIELVTLIEGSCSADLNEDGLLNFFDVSAFLSAFSVGDPSADFTGDGAFNFFDVSAFLQAFSDGCP